MNTLTKEQIEVLGEMESEFADEISDINSGAFATVGPEYAKALINEIMALDARLDAVRSAIATAAAYDKLKAKYEALRAKVETLPKTADGVAVWPGDTVWVITDDDGIQQVETVLELSRYDAHQVEETYSTEQAARDAAGEAK